MKKQFKHSIGYAGMILSILAGVVLISGMIECGGPSQPPDWVWFYGHLMGAGILAVIGGVAMAWAGWIGY